MSTLSTRNSRALSLFDDLVELSADERANRLHELQSSEPELAAALIELLRADAEVSGVLDRGIESIVAEVVDAGAAPAQPAQIGGFALVRSIGRGGMGEVWLAQRGDGAYVQQVALKLLKRGMDSDAVAARFVQERRILAELSHPHIARFIDGGVSEDGRLYFAMEYVAGVDLVSYAVQQRLDVRARVDLLVDVCDAVAHAQAHLVVHRDLKPSNILVDANGQPRVLDFGIAKLLGASAPGETLTQTGVLAMSPSYAAPEQVLGESISTATDVYALGTVLFQMLTGELPQQRQALSLEALVARVHSEQANAPSQVLRRGNATAFGGDTARMSREIAGDLDTIVLTALQREPARRYATAAALADDLRRWLEARPIAAQPDTRGYRMRKFVARNRLAVGSASAVLLALLAGLALALWQASVARQQAARAEEAYRQAQRVNAFFSLRIVESNVTQQAAGAGLTFKDWLLESVLRLDTELADAPSGRANLRREFALSLRELGELEAAAKQGEIAIAEARAVFGHSLELALALQGQGATLNEKGDYDSAQRLLEQSLAIHDTLPPSDEVRLNRVMARTTLLRVANTHGDYAGALAIAQLNIGERGALYGADNYRLAVDYNNLSSIYVRLGRLDDAEQAVVRARELLDRDPSRPQARVAYLDQALCALRILRGAGVAAVATCQQAIALSTQAVGADHGQTLAQRITLASALLNGGAIDESEHEMATLLPAVRAQNLRELDDALTIAARLAMNRQDWSEALRLAQEAADLHDVRSVEAGVLFDRARLLAALAKHALQPSAASLAALEARAKTTVANDSSAALTRAFAAWCVYQGLLLSRKDTAAQSMAETALGLLRKDMDAATAKRQWANWNGPSAAVSDQHNLSERGR